MEASGNKAGNQRKTNKADEVSGRQAGIQRATKTSSEEQPPVCQVCERTGETADANSFCVECNDHMCGTCARVHRGSRTSSEHQLLDESQMPRKAFKVRHMCETHPDAMIEYYCSKQDQLLCRHCIMLNHQGCQGDDLITNICGHVEDRKEFRKMYTFLKDIEQNITQQKSKRNSNMAAIDLNHQKVKHDIDSFKKELYLCVDRLVDDLYEEVEYIVDSNRDAMAAISAECDNVSAHVKDLITEIDIKKQSKEKMQLFIVMKTTQQALDMLGNQVASIDSQNCTRQYNFEPNRQLQDTIRSIQKLGKLSLENRAQWDTVRHAVTQRSNVVFERTVANKVSELETKGNSDEYKCCISGIELLDNDRLAIADYRNKSVNMFSLKQKRITQQQQLPYGPWYITKIGKDTLAVTCPDGGYIQLLSLSWLFGSLSLGRQIQVHGTCYGLQYSGVGGGKMVVSSVNPGKVQIIDFSGTVLKDLSSDLAGTPRFSWPNYVALSPDGQCVYISDGDNVNVTGITLDGRGVFIYRDHQLKYPTGLVVGDDGVFYVCDRWSDNIHMVSGKGRTIKVLLGKKDGVENPQTIMYNITDHILYVGMWYNDNMFVFTYESPSEFDRNKTH